MFKIKLLIVFLIASCCFFACDYIKEPYPETNVNLSDTSTCPEAVFPLVTIHTKKILIEDFTGHTCGNCPKAAKALHVVDSIYPGKIVGLGIHVGGYALPAPGYNGSGSTDFLDDYRTDVGTLYDDQFKASAFGLPEGMFNRKDYDSINSTQLKFYPNWTTYAASIANEPSVVDLQIAVDFDNSTRKLCVAVKDSILSSLTGNYNLTVLLSQDSIIGWQDNIGTNKSDYVHRHVLRDAITPSGAWGEKLAIGGFNAGSTTTRHFAYVVPASYKNVNCDIDQCHVVAFIYNTSTFEIIQVEEVKVTQ